MNKTITLLLTTLSLFALILCVGAIACSDAGGSNATIAHRLMIAIMAVETPPRIQRLSVVMSTSSKETYDTTNRQGTLSKDTVVENLMGIGFTGDVTFKVDSVITFDDMENIVSGTLVGVVGTAATYFPSDRWT